jgi:hypothetical protein
MPLTLPLNEMTTADKLSLVELLWDDLCRAPENLPMPAWHRDVLAARELRLQNAQSRFFCFEEVSERLRKALP